MDILKIEFPATKRKDHLKTVLNELNKGFVRGTIDGYNYQIIADDSETEEVDNLKSTITCLTDALQSIKEHLEYKQTLQWKVNKIKTIIDETEF